MTLCFLVCNINPVGVQIGNRIFGAAKQAFQLPKLIKSSGNCFVAEMYMHVHHAVQ